MKTWYKLFPVLALSVFGMSTYALAAPMELSFQNLFPPMQKQTIDVTEPWAKSFAKKSNGDLIINYYSMGAIVEPSELAHAVANGMLDMAHWTCFFPKDTPYLYLMSIPYLTKSVMHAQPVFEKIIETFPEVQKDLEKAGVILAVHGSAPLALASKNPIKTPADLKGKRVLIPIGSMAELVESFGGIPVLVATGDVYVGLQRGMGEAFISGLSTVRGMKLGEVAKYVTIIGHPMNNPMIFSINKEIYGDLSESQKKLVHELTDGLGNDMIESFRDDTADSIAALEKDGVTVFDLNQEEMQPFIDLVRSTTPAWAKRGEEYGVKNAAELMQRYYEIADSIPDPGENR